MNKSNLKNVKIHVLKNLHFYLLSLNFLFIFTGFYPGFMSNDSLYQYQQSKTMEFTDHHPPIMAGFWSLLNYVFSGPQGLLFFHLLLFGSAVLILFKNFRYKKKAYIIIFICYLPWILNFIGVLWKDVGMAFSLLLFFCLSLNKPKGSLIKKSLKIGIMILVIFYSLSVRHNAFIAVIPILFYTINKWYPKLTIAKSIIYCSGLIALLMIFNHIFTYNMLHASKQNSYRGTMVDDLAYLSISSGKSLIPDISFEELEECSKIYIAETQLHMKDFCLKDKRTYKDNNPFLNNSLNEIWIHEVLNHPYEILYFRLSIFSYFLRSPANSPFYIWQNGISNNQELNKEKIKRKDTYTSLAIEKFVLSTAKWLPFLFKPYWWLWLNSFLYLIYFTSYKKQIEFEALLASSTFYILGYLPLSPGADFRYIYWSVLSTTISIVFLLDGRKKDFFVNSLYTKKKYIGIFVIFTMLLLNFDILFNIKI
jgi:hypothetical protein